MSTLVELAIKPEGSIVVYDAFDYQNVMIIWQSSTITIVDIVNESIVGQIEVASLLGGVTTKTTGKKTPLGKENNGLSIVSCDFSSLNRVLVGVTTDGSVFAIKADNAAALASPVLLKEVHTGACCSENSNEREVIQSILLVPQVTTETSAAATTISSVDVELSVVVCLCSGRHLLVQDVLSPFDTAASASTTAAVDDKSTTRTSSHIKVVQSSLIRQGESGSEFLLHQLIRDEEDVSRHSLYIKQMSLLPGGGGITTVEFDSDCVYAICNGSNTIAGDVSAGSVASTSSSTPKAKRSRGAKSDSGASATAGSASTVVTASLVVHARLNCLSVFLQYTDGSLMHCKYHLEDGLLLYTRHVPLPGTTGTAVSFCSLSEQTVGICCSRTMAVYDVHYGLITETVSLHSVVSPGASCSIHVVNSSIGNGLHCVVEQVSGGSGRQYSCAKTTLALADNRSSGSRGSLSSLLGKLSAQQSVVTAVDRSSGSIVDSISADARNSLQEGWMKYQVARGDTTVVITSISTNNSNISDINHKPAKHYLDLPFAAVSEFLDALKCHVNQATSSSRSSSAATVEITEVDWQMVELVLLGSSSAERRAGASMYSVIKYPELLEVILAHRRYDLLLLLLQYCADLSETAAVRLLAHFMTADLETDQEPRHHHQYKWKAGRKYVLELIPADDDADDAASSTTTSSSEGVGKRKRKSTSATTAPLSGSRGVVKVTNKVLVTCMLHALLARAAGLTYNAHILSEALRKHMPTTGVIVLLQFLASLLKVRVSGKGSVKVTGECVEITAVRMISWVEACIDAKFTTFVASCSLAHEQLTAALQTLLSCVIGLEDNTAGCEQALGLWIHLCRMRQSKEAREGAAGGFFGHGDGHGHPVNIGGACTTMYQIESVFL